MSQGQKKILLIGALPGSLINFRGSLLKAMLIEGHAVFAAANGRDSDTEVELQVLGVKYLPIRIARVGMNPLVDLVTLFDLIRLMRRVKPDVVLSYTIKPVIYGGLAARLCGVRSIYSLITGLGYAFMDASSPRQRLAGWLAKFSYRSSLCHSQRVFFQNSDDSQAFVEMGLVSQDRMVVVNGSGVDLALFPFLAPWHESPSSVAPFRFLLIARLLRDKGIGEYAAAARMIKRKYPQAEFHLLGEFDSNPAGLKPEEVQAWETEGLIHFHGQQTDVRLFIRDCHVYVLPSYREGTPRTVLEAMAMGRAVITTDVPGCRETVRSLVGASEWSSEENAGNLKISRNGILVPVKEVEALATAMEFFIKHPEQVAVMGREGRFYAEERYDVHKVNAVMLSEMGLVSASRESIAAGEISPMLKGSKKILFVGGLPRSLVNFRGPLIKAMLVKGHKVFATANGRDQDTETTLGEMGVEYFPIRIARTGVNPLADMATLFDLIRLINRVEPDVVLNYTIKPIIYGGLAARFCRVRLVFSMVEGLGRAFMPLESLTHFVSSVFAKGLYRIGLLGSKRVFFLNPDDRKQFVKDGYVPLEKAVRLDGIGIDLEHYAKEGLARKPGLRFLMIARLLRDKGVREYVEAARLVRFHRQGVEFVLVGDLDENPSSVQQEELDMWRRDGLVNYVGFIDDVRSFLRDCHVYVLPSYREGTPRTVLEAMATGRALITTDVPGCRETVRRTAGASEWSAEKNTGDLKFGSNGILVPVKNAEALASAMEFFIRHPEQVAVMGKESRLYAEERYDVHKVNAVILNEMGLEEGFYNE